MCKKIVEYYLEKCDHIAQYCWENIDDYNEDSYQNDIEDGPTVKCINCDRLFDYLRSL